MQPLFKCSIYPGNCLLEPDSGIICSCVICVSMSTYTETSSSSSCSSLDCSLKYELNYAESLSVNLQQFLLAAVELLLLCKGNSQPSSGFAPFNPQTSCYNITNSLPPSFPTCWAKNTGKPDTHNKLSIVNFPQLRPPAHCTHLSSSTFHLASSTLTRAKTSNGKQLRGQRLLFAC